MSADDYKKTNELAEKYTANMVEAGLNADGHVIEWAWQRALTDLFAPSTHAHKPL